MSSERPSLGDVENKEQQRTALDREIEETQKRSPALARAKRMFIEMVLPFALGMGGTAWLEKETFKEAWHRAHEPHLIEVVKRSKEVAEWETRIHDRLGISELGAIELPDAVKDTNERVVKLSHARHSVSVVGFEQAPRVKGDLTKRAVEETLPKGFIENVNEICFELQSKGDTDPSYGLMDATTLAETDYETKSITVFREIGASEMEVFMTHLFHEIGHLNDWRSNAWLTVKEKLQLCANVLERLEAENRYRSWYVESIRNDDKKIEKDLKAGEYFAEIVGAYFGSDYALLAPEDKAIVEFVIHKTDPTFNREDSVRIRSTIFLSASKTNDH